MANYEIINKKPMYSSTIIDDLILKSQSRELTYREEKVLQYLKKFNKLSNEDFQKALQELKDLKIARIEENQLFKLLEIMPQTGTELRAIVSHGGVVLVDETVNDILSILNQYR
ncbi:MAG: hypothetical protein ACMXYB_00490 [Candidatus Woesearchaeota archaeon]